MEWWYIPVGAATLVFSAFAVKVALTFDINRWLEQRQQQGEEKLRNTCPHTYLDLQPDGSVLVESYFFSPFGTSEYLCSKCGFRAMNEATAYRIRDMWMDPANFSLYVKREKEFVKLARKLGKI